MEDKYFEKVKKDLLNPGFQQEVFIKRKTLDFESVKFIINTFWNIDLVEDIKKYIQEKLIDLYNYSIEMNYIDKSVSFEQFYKSINNK